MYSLNEMWMAFLFLLENIVVSGSKVEVQNFNWFFNKPVEGQLDGLECCIWPSSYRFLIQDF